MEKLREEKEWSGWNVCSEMSAQILDWNSSLTCCLYLTSEKSYVGGSIARLFSTMSTIFEDLIFKSRKKYLRKKNLFPLL